MWYADTAYHIPYIKCLGDVKIYGHSGSNFWNNAQWAAPAR